MCSPAGPGTGGTALGPGGTGPALPAGGKTQDLQKLEATSHIRPFKSPTCGICTVSVAVLQTEAQFTSLLSPALHCRTTAGHMWFR